MPDRAISLVPGETLLWDGRLSYHRRRLTFATGVSLFLILTGLVLLPLLGIGGTGVAVISLILLFINFQAVTRNAGVRYYITDRRIIRSQVFLGKRTQEIPLESLSDIRTKTFRKKGFIAFSRFGSSRLVFASLDENPEKLKQITMDARSRVTP